MRTEGPVEAALRRACAYWPQWEHVVACAGTTPDVRTVIYNADQQLRRDRRQPGGEYLRGMAGIVDDGDLAEVLTEAICAAEALGL